MVRTPHEGCCVHCVGLVCLGAIRCEESHLVAGLHPIGVLPLDVAILIQEVLAPTNLVVGRDGRVGVGVLFLCGQVGPLTLREDHVLPVDVLSLGLGGPIVGREVAPHPLPHGDQSLHLLGGLDGHIGRREIAVHRDLGHRVVVEDIIILSLPVARHVGGRHVVPRL